MSTVVRSGGSAVAKFAMYKQEAYSINLQRVYSAAVYMSHLIIDIYLEGRYEMFGVAGRASPEAREADADSHRARDASHNAPQAREQAERTVVGPPAPPTPRPGARGVRVASRSGLG